MIDFEIRLSGHQVPGIKEKEEKKVKKKELDNKKEKTK